MKSINILKQSKTTWRSVQLQDLRSRTAALIVACVTRRRLRSAILWIEATYSQTRVLAHFWLAEVMTGNNRVAS